MNRFLTNGLVASVAGAISLLAAPLASARDYVSWSVNVGVPAVGYPVYASPVYSQPQVVYQQPQRVYVEPAPVYYERAPVYYEPAPIYVRPAAVYGPVVYYNSYAQPRYWGHRPYGYGYGYGGRYYGR